MAKLPRRRTISATDPGGEPICTLTPGAAAARSAPIDRLIARGRLDVLGDGYEIRLARDERAWRMAEQFIEEEAACCPAFAFEAAEEGDTVVVRAAVSRHMEPGSSDV